MDFNKFVAHNDESIVGKDAFKVFVAAKGIGRLVVSTPYQVFLFELQIYK